MQSNISFTSSMVIEQGFRFVSWRVNYVVSESDDTKRGGKRSKTNKKKRMKTKKTNRKGMKVIGQWERVWTNYVEWIDGGARFVAEKRIIIEMETMSSSNRDMDGEVMFRHFGELPCRHHHWLEAHPLPICVHPQLRATYRESAQHSGAARERGSARWERSEIHALDPHTWNLLWECSKNWKRCCPWGPYKWWRTWRDRQWRGSGRRWHDQWLGTHQYCHN